MTRKARPCDCDSRRYIEPVSKIPTKVESFAVELASIEGMALIDWQLLMLQIFIFFASTLIIKTTARNQ